MQEKETYDLEKVLGKTHPEEFDVYLRDNLESMLSASNSFCAYYKEILKKHGISQQMVFLKAEVPEGYGYKILTGEKLTRQRDVIIRLCYAAEFTLEEIQRALKKYGMAELYAKIPRDAMIMIAFNERPGSINELNTLLEMNGLEPLRTSGTQGEEKG